MENANRRIAVYGAYGHTGRFIVAELLRRGFTPVPSGRDAARLAALSIEHGGLESRLAALDDPAALDRAFHDTLAVINAAGPFLDSATPVLEATLRSRIHYLDLAAEQGAVQSVFERFDAPARRAGIALLPAVAFYGGLADLLASAAMGDWPAADAVDVAVALDRWWPTRGTRLTGERNTLTRLIVAGRELVPLPNPPPSRRWDFPAPFGTQEVIMLPLSETVLLQRHVRAADIRSWMSLQPLADLRDPATPPPSAVDGDGRSAQNFLLEVVVRRGSEERRAHARGRDIYAASAPLAVEALQRLLDHPGHPRGAFAPGQLFDGAGILGALAAQAMAVELDAR